jgi:hypothetical protein
LVSPTRRRWQLSGREVNDVQQQPEFFKLSAEDIRYLRITAEVIASNKPLAPHQRSKLAKAMLVLLDKAELIECGYASPASGLRHRIHAIDADNAQR